jgi:very-short-patch-repair endonuclease
VTRRDLLAVGLSKDAIHRSVRSGRLYPVYLGVYAVGRPPRTPLEHAAAAVLACGPGAALSHRAALALWGFQKRWPPPPFDVTTRANRGPRGIRAHRVSDLTGADIRTHHGIRVTSPARTLLDCVPGLDDKQLTRLVNDALLTPYLHEAALADVLARFPRHPGAARLERCCKISGGPTRSQLEDDFKRFCRQYGLQTPKTNVLVAGHLVDALFEDEKLIVELDGWGFHSSRASFENDRDRDADTLLAGFATVRVTSKRMANAPRQEGARLHAILAARRI